MDKNAIKKYAVWARRELIERVSRKALQYGISEETCGDMNAVAINEHVLTAEEKKQRQALIAKIEKDGYRQVMEEAAYTWFNRFCALRYMEVNGYLPTHVRVFSDDRGNFKPQILTEAIHLELDGLDMEKVYALKERNKTDQLYKYLLITQCNALSAILPGMFQKIADYTELLFPDNILREGSVIERMITLIPEEDWTDQVQIIGWLYQYYNTEPKDEVFAALKKNIKISKENIPAATQLFTPDWIVHYMVENSLGRLWAEGHPNAEMKASWKYYLEEAEQEPEVQKQLETIRVEYARLKPEDIRVIDPCMGSGHILVVMFDVLMQIYESYGYAARKAASMIVENNLWGLDIDERAAQLSYFAVMMKARQYDSRFFSRKVELHVYAIEESNGITTATMHDMGIELSQEEHEKAVKEARRLVEELQDAKEYGSIIHVTPCDWNLLRRFAVPRGESEGQMSLDIHGETEAAKRLQKLIDIGEALAQKYDVVCTNPPYMGSSNMNPKLNEYIKEKYADYKSDFFSAFVVRASEMTTANGYCGFFTPYVWMFIQSYEKLRRYLYTRATIETLIQFEYSAFEEATVPVCTFVFGNSRVKGKKGNYLRLVDFRGGMEVQRQKTLEAINDHNCGYYYEQTTDNFSKIPGSPVAYWVSDAVYSMFNNKPLVNYMDFKEGITTGDNNVYLRLWHEVAVTNIYFNNTEVSSRKTTWIPCNKGGEFRRWYGNRNYIIDWSENGMKLKGFKGSSFRNADYQRREGGTFSNLSSGLFGARYSEAGFAFESKGTMFFGDNLVDVLAYVNSKAFGILLEVVCPTLDFKFGIIQKLPYKPDHQTLDYTKSNISLSRADWDSYETSWDFKRHPLI